MNQQAINRYSHFHPSTYQKITSNLSRIKNATSELSIKKLTTGFKIMISPDSHQFLEKLSPYQRIQISRKIASLSATPRPFDAAKQKGSKEIYVVTEKNTGFSTSYKIVNNTIYVLEILPNPKLSGIAKELPCLYRVKRQSDNNWLITKKDITDISTNHTAINGQSNILQRATSLMGIHVEKTFKSDNVREYTLFHNPSDGGFWDTYESSQDKKQKTTAVSKQFSHILSNVQDNGKPVKWLAHSQGGLIFTEAARYHWEQKKTELSLNSVQFNAGANNEETSNFILKQVKIDVLDYNNHPFDPVPNIIGGNAKDWVSKLGSFIGFAFVFTDDADKSPHTLPYDGNSTVVTKVYNIKNKSALAVQSIINAMPK